MNSQYSPLQRNGFIVIGAETIALLAIIGLASFKSNDFIFGILALVVGVWVSLLIFFAIWYPMLIWPIALLQTTIVVVIAVPAATLADSAVIKCFFLGMATIAIANGLARLRARLKGINSMQ